MHQKMERSELCYNAVYSALTQDYHRCLSSIFQYEMHLGAVVTVTPACLASLGTVEFPHTDQCWFICISSCVMRPNNMAGHWFTQQAGFPFQMLQGVVELPLITFHSFL